MGNVPYYLRMPHRNTHYVYYRDENRAYGDAPLHIWHGVEREDALKRFFHVLTKFKEQTEYSCIYLYKGVKRLVKVDKQTDGSLLVISPILDEFIAMFPYYERVNVETIKIV